MGLGPAQPPGDISVKERLDKIDWDRVHTELDERGFGPLGLLLSPGECRALIAAYDAPDRYRSRVIMERHTFGRGEYRYFAYPLPPLVAELRSLAYPRLAAVANRWWQKLGLAAAFPPSHAAFLAACRARGQSQPTPLILKYGPGDYNRLHQDLYGELFFPLQLTVLLSQPITDFAGGEFVLVEQKPRAQSRATVVPLAQGEAVAFAVQFRAAPGVRGHYRAPMRHGVSDVRRGERFALGIIFHDAQ